MHEFKYKRDERVLLLISAERLCRRGRAGWKQKHSEKAAVYPAGVGKLRRETRTT